MNALGAAVRAGALDRVVVRSGTRGLRPRPRPSRGPRRAPRRSARPLRTDASASTSRRTRPGWRAVTTSPWPQLRLAPVSGSRAPSPIGRLLATAGSAGARCSPIRRSSSSTPTTPRRAMLEAVVRGADGAFNVVGPGAASPWQAVRLGNRIPVPFVGPGWLVARTIAELAGSPVPPHVLELIRAGPRRRRCRGRSRSWACATSFPTQEVVTDLYAWASVTSFPGTVPRARSARPEHDGMSPTVAAARRSPELRHRRRPASRVRLAGRRVAPPVRRPVRGRRVRR